MELIAARRRAGDLLRFAISERGAFVASLERTSVGRINENKLRDQHDCDWRGHSTLWSRLCSTASALSQSRSTLRAAVLEYAINRGNAPRRFQCLHYLYQFETSV